MDFEHDRAQLRALISNTEEPALVVDQATDGDQLMLRIARGSSAGLILHLEDVTHQLELGAVSTGEDDLLGMHVGIAGDQLDVIGRGRPVTILLEGPARRRTLHARRARIGPNHAEGCPVCANRSRFVRRGQAEQVIDLTTNGPPRFGSSTLYCAGCAAPLEDWRLPRILIASAASTAV